MDSTCKYDVFFSFCQKNGALFYRNNSICCCYVLFWNISDPERLKIKSTLRMHTNSPGSGVEVVGAVAEVVDKSEWVLLMGEQHIASGRVGG